MISFRASDEEYEAAMGQCEQTGTRTVSALARVAFLNAIEAESSKKGIGTRRMARLERQVNDLMARVVAMERKGVGAKASVKA